MKRLLFLCLTLLAATAALPGAQAPAGGPAPATPAAGPGRGGGRGPQVVSPEVHADNRITLRFNAPNAELVELIGELDGRTYPMTKNANGIWEVTVGPWPHDVYNYQFRVDAVEGRGGVIAMDPVNPSVKLGFGAFPPASMVEVPAEGGLGFEDARNVPHGSVRMETYHSETMGVPRTLWIYTPPGYETGNERYPVFYLLHGAGNIDSSWMLTGRANYIMDNLIAEGRARPMIIVNPFGYARQGIGTGPDRILTEPGGPGGGGRGSAQNTLFARDVLTDVIPFVERKFRTVANADNRALGGLSMGGGQTVAIGFPNIDTFHSLVIMSAGANAQVAETYPEFFNNPAQTNEKLDLLWIGVGKDDFALNGSRTLDEALTKAGIDHTFMVGEGRHEWVVWRHHLREVAPLLFK
jgi:enterochelin esterase family protein